MKVLYVEDNPADVDLTKHELEKSGGNFELEVVGLCREALDKLKHKPNYDVALIDLRLPDGDGISILSHIRKKKFPICVIIITGSGDEETAVAALKAGADDYVTKSRDYHKRLPLIIEKAVKSHGVGISSGSKPLRLLYAEHNTADAKLTAHHLKLHAPNILLEVVNSANDALSKFPEQGSVSEESHGKDYDVLMFDYRLPGMNALELVKEIRDVRRLDIPIIIVTGQGDEEIAAQAIKVGANDYIVKTSAYLYRLPSALENAFRQAELARERAALRESEGKFRNLVESSLVGVYLIQDGKFAYVNPAMAKIFRYAQDELVSMPSILQTIAAEDRGKVLENIRKRVEGEAESIRYEFHGVRKDGEVIDVEVLGSRTIYGGKPAIIGTIEDITERKRAVENLRESEERYRAIFEESLDAIYISTPEGKMLDINSAGVKLFGYNSKEELLSVEDVREYYVDLNEREKFVTKLEASGIIRNFEIKMRRRDGEVLTVLDSANVVRDKNGKVAAYRGILRDITAEKKLEEQLIQSQKLESLGQLTSGIAHDFNNVLGGIIGFSELALGKIEESHPVHNYLMRIYGLADRAAKITKQLLAFARRQILQPKNLDVNELITDFMDLLPRVLGEHVQISFVPDAELKTVRADPSQIEQVLINLAVNAGDAMPNGGKLIIETRNTHLDEFYCRVHTNVQPGEYVMIAVSDTGTGIDESVKQRIFEPFFTTKEVGKGTGLGLSVVHGIIRQHGGSINVYSEAGKGTTFKMYFPAVGHLAESLGHRPTTGANLNRGDETVLVVEDNEELREFIKTLLEESGYSVLTAAEGVEGVGVFEQHSQKISLVITDIMMPKMSGRELRKVIDSRHPGTKFLFISGYTENAVHHGFILDPDVDFLQKPFTVNEFSEKVRNILDRSSG